MKCNGFYSNFCLLQNYTYICDKRKMRISSMRESVKEINRVHDANCSRSIMHGMDKSMRWLLLLSFFLFFIQTTTATWMNRIMVECVLSLPLPLMFFLTDKKSVRSFVLSFFLSFIQMTTAIQTTTVIWKDWFLIESALSLPLMFFLFHFRIRSFADIWNETHIWM